MELSELKINDEITRMISGIIPMSLKITNIDDKYIYCGDWKFSKTNGAEIDEDLNWDENNTGSFIKLN
jgi:hypothetical protein